MRLDDYSLLDARVVLIRAEQLSPAGLDDAARAFLADRAGWDRPRLDLFDEAFRRYFRRAEALSRRAPELAPPRLRNVAVVRDPLSVRPFGQILNESTWTMYDCDFDPVRSDAELAAYLFVHGDRLAQVREVTFAAVHLAPYWFERSDAERRAFAAAAARSPRPDAAVYRAIAGALPWMRHLRHARLRPPRAPGGLRAVPGTGLLVPRSIEREPERLVERSREAAAAALEAFYARARRSSAAVLEALVAWLADAAPPLVVTASGDRIVWDAERPGEVAALRRELGQAGEAALRDVHADLEVVAERTRRFLAATVAPEALAPPDASVAQSGYVYMHRERQRLAYNLHEPAVERLLGPAMPYARSMLGARAVHEWAHAAVDSGWVPRTADESAWSAAVARLADELDAAIAQAPRPVRETTERGLRALPGVGSPGRRLCDVLVSRIPDWQANLLAARLWSVPERETYVRQNVRPLRAEYPPERLWSMLVRYLYERQYLAFSDVADRARYFASMTWLDRDLLEDGALTEERFEALVAAAAALCRAHAVDESRFRFA